MKSKKILTTLMIILGVSLCLAMFTDIGKSKPIPEQPSCGQAWKDKKIYVGMPYSEVVRVVGQPSRVGHYNGRVNEAFWCKKGYYLSWSSKNDDHREADMHDYCITFDEYECLESCFDL